MSMRLMEYRILAILLDGDNHSLEEIVQKSRNVLPPNDLVRIYNKRFNLKGNTGTEDLDVRTQKGLEFVVGDVLLSLEKRGMVSYEVTSGKQYHAITNHGMDRITKPISYKNEETIPGKRASRPGGDTTSGGVLRQVLELFSSGDYWIVLVPREHTEADDTHTPSSHINSVP